MAGLSSTMLTAVPQCREWQTDKRKSHRAALGNLSLDRVFPFPTFLCHLKLFRMTIQQDPYETDPYETDPWWFAPMLYVGLGLAIAGLATAGLHLIVALGVR
jgi:hypothetical protein